MKIGSIVRLSRPWMGEQRYKDAIGIVEVIGNIGNSDVMDGYTCKVRIGNPDNRCTHCSITCFIHRLDILKE